MSSKVKADEARPGEDLAAQGAHTEDTGAPKRKRKKKKKTPPYRLEEKLKAFWKSQHKEIEELTDQTTNDFKAHNDLPKARIKRIMQVMMQADEQCASVRMIRAEAPILFAKACEMFILELSLRAYGYSVIRQRKNLNKQDVRNAVNDTINLDFLSHILKENDAPSGADAADNSGVNQATKADTLQQPGLSVDQLPGQNPQQRAHAHQQQQALLQQQKQQQTQHQMPVQHLQFQVPQPHHGHPQFQLPPPPQFQQQAQQQYLQQAQQAQPPYQQHPPQMGYTNPGVPMNILYGQQQR